MKVIPSNWSRWSAVDNTHSVSSYHVKLFIDAGQFRRREGRSAEDLDGNWYEKVHYVRRASRSVIG